MSDTDCVWQKSVWAKAGRLPDARHGNCNAARSERFETSGRAAGLRAGIGGRRQTAMPGRRHRAKPEPRSSWFTCRGAWRHFVSRSRRGSGLASAQQCRTHGRRRTPNNSVFATHHAGEPCADFGRHWSDQGWARRGESDDTSFPSLPGFCWVPTSKGADLEMEARPQASAMEWVCTSKKARSFIQ